MKKFVILFLFAGIVAIGATYEPVVSNLPLCDFDNAQHIMNSVHNGYKTSIFTERITAVIRVCEYNQAGTESSVKNATQIEIDAYNASIIEQKFIDASISLQSEVEIGKKWVDWLREYADEQRNAATAWDGYTTNQKLVVMQTKLEKDAKVMDGLADLLILLHAQD